jgi:hypothetical protein
MPCIINEIQISDTQAVQIMDRLKLPWLHTLGQSYSLASDDEGAEHLLMSGSTRPLASNRTLRSWLENKRE